jgi:hypothetical protein
MYTERLLKLADILDDFENQKPEGVERFDMESWHCGTAACAAGTAALHPWFNGQGLYMGASVWSPGRIPRYNGYINFTALENFFEISEADAAWLFDPMEYDNPYLTPVHPWDVATRIRILVADFQETQQ